MKEEKNVNLILRTSSLDLMEYNKYDNIYIIIIDYITQSLSFPYYIKTN